MSSGSGSSGSGPPTPASTARATRGASPASSDRSIHSSSRSERSGSSSGRSSDRGFSPAAPSSKRSRSSISTPAGARPPASSPRAIRQEPTTSIERKTPNPRNTSAPAPALSGHPLSSSSSPHSRSTGGAGPSHAPNPLGSREVTARDTQTITHSQSADQIREELLRAKCKLILFESALRQASPGSDAGHARRQIQTQEAHVDQLTRQFDAAIFRNEPPKPPASASASPPHSTEKRIAEIMRKHRDPARRLVMLKKELNALWDFIHMEDEEDGGGEARWSHEGTTGISLLNSAIREQDALIAARDPPR